MLPRTLGSAEEQQARLARAQELHVAPLNAWAASLGKDGRYVPHFDPDDGGVNARVLFLLESPGPAVSRTEFISMDNPDGTAENMHSLIEASGISRSDLVLWNVVPWQLSTEGVKAPKADHHREALPATRHLLTLLLRLEAVVLVGRHAQRAWAGVGSDLRTLEMPHPSPQNFNTRPQARAAALSALVFVRELLESRP